MIINHNIAALNTHRQMGSAQSAQMNSMEKLSSGLRINKASDDAAGLSISEKMRGQIRGLEQASSNAQDGISLMQTAEGALNETHDILQRMRELAVQSANDTNTDTDRGELQKEVNQLAEEITRIAENTEFNTMNLLGKDGKGFEGKFHIGANGGQDITLQINDMGASALNVNGVNAGADATVGDLTVNNLTADGYTVNFTAASTDTASGAGAVAETTATVDKDARTITVTLAQAGGDGAAAGDLTASNADIAKALEDTGLVSAVAANPTDVPTTVPTGGVAVDAGTVDTTKGINISSQSAASSAIETINDSIETVSAERSKLGATQNRLEHTINNLGTSAENLTAAESRIRDVDYAEAA
ncbi:MAG: flagellin [Bacillota bacterium]